MALADSANLINVLKDSTFQARVDLVGSKLGGDVLAVNGGALVGDTDQAPSAGTMAARLSLAKVAILGTAPSNAMAAACVLDAAVQAAVLLDPGNGMIQPSDTQLYTALRKAWTSVALART